MAASNITGGIAGMFWSVYARVRVCVYVAKHEPELEAEPKVEAEP